MRDYDDGLSVEQLLREEWDCLTKLGPKSLRDIHVYVLPRVSPDRRARVRLEYFEVRKPPPYQLDDGARYWRPAGWEGFPHEAFLGLPHLLAHIPAFERALREISLLIEVSGRQESPLASARRGR